MTTDPQTLQKVNKSQFSIGRLEPEYLSRTQIFQKSCIFVQENVYGVNAQKFLHAFFGMKAGHTNGLPIWMLNIELSIMREVNFIRYYNFGNKILLLFHLMVANLFLRSFLAVAIDLLKKMNNNIIIIMIDDIMFGHINACYRSWNLSIH